MIDITFVVVLYGLGALTVGYFIYKEVQEPDFRVKNDKLLGPSYWGIYNNLRLEDEALRAVTPPPSSEDRARERIINDGQF